MFTAAACTYAVQRCRAEPYKTTVCRHSSSTRHHVGGCVLWFHLLLTASSSLVCTSAPPLRAALAAFSVAMRSATDWNLLPVLPSTCNSNKDMHVS